MRKLILLCLSLCLLAFGAPLLAQDAPTVGLGSTDELGQFLVGPEGLTLYIFTRDPLGESVCYDQCADRWPPLTVASADAVTADPAIPGEFGTIERTDGTLQVTYNDLPLYYWFEDEAPGDTKGNAVGGVWWVMPPATVYAWTTPDLGETLVGPNGMTLYMFANDQDGVSACYDQCATNWPPLTVDSADDLVLGVNLPGELGTTERTDGTLQVTYNNMPLYFWNKDENRGDTTGENVGEVWFTVAPETVAISSSDDLGDFLTTTSGMTLYMFTRDTEGVSNCSGDCAGVWPPFTIAENDRLALPTGAMGELGTITREDGTLQVTYNGTPLYLYADDKAPGDTVGQGVGDSWYVVAP